MILRTMDRKPINTTTHTKKCEICEKATREGKPFCPEHVEHNDYVRDILQILEVQAEEHAKVLTRAGIRAITSDSLTAREMVKVLSVRGTSTVNRISREMNLDLKLVEVYARYLVKRQITHSGITTRGARTLTLLR